MLVQTGTATTTTAPMMLLLIEQLLLQLDVRGYLQQAAHTVEWGRGRAHDRCRRERRHEIAQVAAVLVERSPPRHQRPTLGVDDEDPRPGFCAQRPHHIALVALVEPMRRLQRCEKLNVAQAAIGCTTMMSRR